MNLEGPSPNSPHGDQLSQDPVHPGPIRSGAATPGETATVSASARTPAAQPAARPRTRTLVADRPPRAADLGFPAVLDHELVAVALADPAAPVTIFRWAGDGPRALKLIPLDAQVWARAGRVTLIGSDGAAHRLTLLAPDEYTDHRIGEHWPLGEPEGRAKRVAAATLRDLGDVLTFPVWLAHTAHLSGERNTAAKRFLRDLAAASPGTVVQHNQTSGTPQSRPGQLRPYEHRGLIGKEGYPKEL